LSFFIVTRIHIAIPPNGEEDTKIQNSQLLGVRSLIINIEKKILRAKSLEKLSVKILIKNLAS
jgi:hypothetical protein